MLSVVLDTWSQIRRMLSITIKFVINFQTKFQPRSPFGRKLMKNWESGSYQLKTVTNYVESLALWRGGTGTYPRSQTTCTWSAKKGKLIHIWSHIDRTILLFLFENYHKPSLIDKKEWKKDLKTSDWWIGLWLWLNISNSNYIHQNIHSQISTISFTEISPLHVIVVTQIVALDAFIQIVQHHDGCHEVDHLASRQVIQVVAAVPTSIAVSIASERQSRSNGFEKDAEKDDWRKWMSQRENSAILEWCFAKCPNVQSSCMYVV